MPFIYIQDLKRNTCLWWEIQIATGYAQCMIFAFLSLTPYSQSLSNIFPDMYRNTHTTLLKLTLFIIHAVLCFAFFSLSMSWRCKISTVVQPHSLSIQLCRYLKIYWFIYSSLIWLLCSGLSQSLWSHSEVTVVYGFVCTCVNIGGLIVASLIFSWQR